MIVIALIALSVSVCLLLYHTYKLREDNLQLILDCQQTAAKYTDRCNMVAFLQEQLTARNTENVKLKEAARAVLHHYKLEGIEISRLQELCK